LKNVAVFHADELLSFDAFSIDQDPIGAFKIQDRDPFILQPNLTMEPGNSLLKGVVGAEIHIRDNWLALNDSAQSVIVAANQR
jgi:hypothetical protein